MSKVGKTPEPVGAATPDDLLEATLPSQGPGATPLLPRGTAVGRYLIATPLGAGGMGVVYVADDPDLRRRVALKLLRPNAGGDGSLGRARLLREAHAMARLNHPNVVVIHDVGVYGDQIFLAMELVEGTDLRRWVAAAGAALGWREILGLFLQAGRGLAAAHAAGLVHRDFKPENVLVGNDGVVKVGDFGLARAAGDTDPGATRAPVAEKVVLADTLRLPITHVGSVSGTPAYMAPEQRDGRAIDARTDEFCFCVALYEALYGRRPTFSRDGTGPSAVPPAGSHVPQWLHRIVLRGLSVDPNDRYQTLAELLASLAADPAVRRRRIFARAGVAALVAGAAAASALLVARQRALADPCHDPDARLGDVWNAAVRARLRAAFAATGNPDAAATASYAEKAMDRASGAWLAAYRDACDATRVRHAQPESALNLRLDCLAEQRLDLQAAGEILLSPEPKDLSSAIGAASSLPLPSECADARALSVVEQPSPEKRPRVEALRRQLARARALEGAGRSGEAIEAIGRLPEEAHALDAPSLEVEALLALVGAYNSRAGPGDDRSACDFAERAATLAEAAHLDQLATQAASLLALLQDLLASPPAKVDASLQRAHDDLRRAGLGGAAEFGVEEAATLIELSRGHAPEAAAHGQRALVLADEGRHFGRLDPFDNLALVETSLGQYDEALRLLRETIARSDSLLGPRNQRVLIPQMNLAEMLLSLGRTEEAARALAQLFARMRPDVDRDEFAMGLATEAALKATLGKRAESLATLRRALEMAERLHMLASPAFVDVHVNAAESYLRDGEPELAVGEYEGVLAHNGMMADSVDALRLGGWAYLDSGQPRKALPILERALQLGSAHPLYPGWVARLRYQLAKALVATRGDRSRAEALAQAAYDELSGLPNAKGLLAEVEAWRSKTFGLPAP